MWVLVKSTRDYKKRLVTNKLLTLTGTAEKLSPFLIHKDMENNQKNQLNIEISDEVAEGTYSNLAIITHSPNEFIVDFAQMMPGTPKAKVRSRVILNPLNAKRLYKALADNIAKYEQQYGTINDGGGIAPFNMGIPTAQA